MITRPKRISKLLACRPKPGYSRGAILIIALWSLCLLAIFAVQLSSGVRQKFIFVNRIEEIDKLHFIAEAGVKKAIVELVGEPKKDYDALTDKWSNNPAAFKDIKLDNGKFSVYYNYMDKSSGLRGIVYGLVDEERKININYADQFTLRRLFRIALNFDRIKAQELAASIFDWRDEDNLLSIPLGSAEDSYYRSRQYAYEAKDAAFDVLDEVLLVKGMDMETFDRVKDYITIYGNGGININTVSEEVMLALGMDETLVDKILLFRWGKDGIPFNQDDNVFKTVTEIVPKLSQFSSLSDSEVTQLTAARDRYFTTDSTCFMVKSLAQLNTSDNVSEITAVIDQSGTVLYWREF